MKIGMRFVVLTLHTIFSAATFAEEWEGEYGYSEVADAKRMMIWDYRLKVFEERYGLFANLEVDGFQVGIRVKCKVETTGKKAKFIVSEIGPDHIMPSLKPGDLLFELEEGQSKISTHWYVLEPNLPGSSKLGVYFEKLK